jgi:Protein of unknown function (DUF3298)/Deacetylase PdaC
MKRQETKAGNCDSIRSGCVRVAFEYPQLKGEGPILLRDSVEAFLRSFLFAPIREGGAVKGFEDVAGEVIAEYRNLREEFSDYRIDWELDRRVSVLADTAGVVSIRCSEFSFLGGAHPNQVIRLGTFVVPSGRRLSLSDCVVPGAEARLTEAVEREFRTVRSLSPEQSLEEAGFWFEKGAFVLASNWAAEASGLIFYYNDYEIAPHALGPTEVRVSFAALKGIVSPEGPLGQLAAH